MASLTGDYRFAAEPRQVTDRSKYRSPFQQQNEPVNIMFDRRVIRGNTYAVMVVPNTNQQDADPQTNLKNQSSKRFDDTKQDFALEEERDMGTPEPVDGRLHIFTQTAEVIEELTDKPPEKEQEAQTQFYIDRPPSPLFTPKLSGDCIETQIEDGELFDFDTEVIPILDVLVGKTLEQSRLEVLEDEELLIQREQQREYEQIRNQRILEVQRLEAEEVRKHQESERRKLQARTRRDQLKLVHQKYCSRIISKLVLKSLKSKTVKKMKDTGVFRHPQNVALQTIYMPWLFGATEDFVQIRSDFILETAKLFRSAYADGCRKHGEALRQEKERKQQLERQKEQERKEYQEKIEERRRKREVRRLEREKKALYDRIDAELIQPGQFREPVSQQMFSDIDGRYSEPVISTIGGLIGEIILLVQAMETVNEEQFTDEQLSLLLQKYLQYGMRCPHLNILDIDRNTLLEFFDTLQIEDLTLDSIHDQKDEVKAQIKAFILNPSHLFPRSTLQEFWKRPKKYGLRPGLAASIVGILYNWAIQKEDSSGLSQKLKIELRDLPQSQVQEKAVAKIIIPSKQDDSDLNISDDQDKKDSYAEIENIEDKALFIQPTIDDLSVFLIHQGPQRILRHQLVNFIKSLKEFKDIDIEQLKITLESQNKSVEKKIIQAFAGNLPVFKYDRN